MAKWIDLLNKIFFLIEKCEQVILSVFLCTSYINIKIIRSKFKNNKNFTFFTLPKKKKRILKMKVVLPQKKKIRTLYIQEKKFTQIWVINCADFLKILLFFWKIEKNWTKLEGHMTLFFNIMRTKTIIAMPFGMPWKRLHFISCSTQKSRSNTKTFSSDTIKLLLLDIDDKTVNDCG